MPQKSKIFKRGDDRLVEILNPQQRKSFQDAGLFSGTSGIERINGKEFFKVPNPQALSDFASKGFVDPRQSPLDLPGLRDTTRGAARIRDTRAVPLPGGFQRLPGSLKTRQQQNNLFDRITPFDHSGNIIREASRIGEKGSFLAGVPKPTNIDTATPIPTSIVEGGLSEVDVTIPTTSGDELRGSIDRLRANYDSFVNFQKERAVKLQDQVNTLMEQNKQFKDKALEVSEFSTQQLLNDTFANLGLDKELFDRRLGHIDKMEGHAENIKNLLAQRAEAESKIQEQNISVPFRFTQGRIAREQQSFDRAIASETAAAGMSELVIQAIDGHIDQARLVTGDIVAAATYDQSVQLSTLESFITENQRLIDNLNADQKILLDDILQTRRDELAFVREEKEKILNLVLQVPSAGWESVDLSTVTLDQATEIAQKEQKRLFQEESKHLNIVSLDRGNSIELYNDDTGETIRVIQKDEQGNVDPFDRFKYAQELVKNGIYNNMGDAFSVVDYSLSGGEFSIDIPQSSRLAYVNNNPGNLRFVGQAGASQGEGGFARFENPVDGFWALVDQVKLDASRGHTISSYVNKFAPPSENDTELYLKQMTETLGVAPHTFLNSLDPIDVAIFQARKESSTRVTSHKNLPDTPQEQTETGSTIDRSLDLDDRVLLLDENGNTIRVIDKSTNSDVLVDDASGQSAESGVNETVRSNPALSSAVSALMVRLPKAQGEILDSEINRLMENNDFEGAKELLRVSSLSVVPTSQQDRVIGRAEAIEALDRVTELLTEYESSGGETGFFTGNVEKLAQKIGKTTDPQLARIQESIRLALVDYRRAVSGAAFTESEKKEYEVLFPSIGKVKEFNESIISELLGTFERNQRVFMEQIIGPDTYTTLFNESNAENTLQPNQRDPLGLFGEGGSFGQNNPGDPLGIL